jgi:FkbM family methyltransferase
MGEASNNSELDRLISPEIKNDEFYLIIQKIAREENIQTVLEIGSSSGGGSTEAFVTGLRENPNHPSLYCIEVSQPRFTELSLRYRNDRFVKCYNVSSVPVDKFPDRQQIINFYHNTPNNLKSYPVEQVLDWLRQDIDYVNNSGLCGDGIARIKQENQIDYFDLVLIDGSEFTGSAELAEVYGAKYIFLDDITTYKNYDSHRRLLADPNYTLLAENTALRNGYSVFKKIEYEREEFLSVQEESERLLVKNYVKKDMIVFDVGANIGDYSLMLSKLVGDTGKVYAFEPASSTFNKLKERLDKNNCKNILPFQYAIYSENTQIKFNEFPDDFSVWNSIGKPEMLDPSGSGKYISIVQTEMVEAVKLDDFCQVNQVKSIDYLKVDVEGAESDVFQGAINLLRNKSIKLIQFEISQKMLEGLNRQAQSTFDLLTTNGYECHQILVNGKIGNLVSTSNSFYENYIAFPVVPINFFTIVLNGQPFIKYHIDIFKQLPFKWHWHIVEGVADLKYDTSWSLDRGGQISDGLHDRGLSNDGTTEYLDELVQLYPENVTIYRQPAGVFWDGKREMVNAPLKNIQEECLLWQVDVDELWTLEQLYNARQMFINHPEKTAAFYWCWYFVGETQVISTRNCYAQNPQQEWLRTWRFKPGAFWATHEPPSLVETLADGQNRDIAAVNPFRHPETESNGLVFQHFAYVTPAQLQFKEQYYGYQDAVSQWEKLQQQTKFPVLLSEYFAWVKDRTQVEKVDKLGIIPIAQKENNTWQFVESPTINNLTTNVQHLQQFSAETLQIELDRVRQELRDAQSKIASMESTKFWKLREQWFKFKKMFRVVE